MKSHLLLLTLTTLLTSAFAQIAEVSPRTHASPVSLTGLLLLNDWKCNQFRETAARSSGDLCPIGGVRWKLYSGTELYPLRENSIDLQQFERTRVTITGTFAGKSLVIDRVMAAEISDNEIQSWVQQLQVNRWEGPHNFTNPTHWFFSFTPPMLNILQSGAAAREILLEHIGDHEIKDQILILLGGVGDESVIEPIIQAMADSPAHSPDSKQINLAANLALTNITQAEVIWHHGGGMNVDRCPGDPKSCWYAWWIQNRDKFKVADEKENRNYSNYPNYGIYQQP